MESIIEALFCSAFISSWVLEQETSKVSNRLTLNLHKCLELTETQIKTRYDPNGNRKYNANKLEGEEDKYGYYTK